MLKCVSLIVNHGSIDNFQLKCVTGLRPWIVLTLLALFLFPKFARLLAYLNSMNPEAAKSPPVPTQQRCKYQPSRRTAHSTKANNADAKCTCVYDSELAGPATLGNETNNTKCHCATRCVLSRTIHRSLFICYRS